MQYTILGNGGAATPSSESGSQNPRQEISLPLSLHGSGPDDGIPGATMTVCDSRDADVDANAGDGGATSLERFGATTGMADHSMQEWVSELEEFLGPLLGL